MLDFRGLVSQQGLNIAWSAVDTVEFSRIGAVGAGEASGFEGVIGTSQGDIIQGSTGNDRINGHLGADSLFGGGGDDFIFFDFADGMNVNGGTGRDVAVALGDIGVTVDMAAQGLECVIGCDGDDTIVVSGASKSLFAAGGAGADTFHLVFGDEESPRVLWGGAGADTFIFEEGMHGGIAVVSIAGLTEEAFARLTLDDLDLGGLPLNEFRAIILNPDASDRFVVLARNTTPRLTWKAAFSGRTVLTSSRRGWGAPFPSRGTMRPTGRPRSWRKSNGTTWRTFCPSVGGLEPGTRGMSSSMTHAIRPIRHARWGTSPPTTKTRSTSSCGRKRFPTMGLGTGRSSSSEALSAGGSCPAT
ncbi:MAG TPA: hypothetical protein GX399_12490, partial [Xanthomonadaceae bacterium]|nr:hypothetical protein [Xanthomonadaceae bacterium]